VPPSTIILNNDWQFSLIYENQSNQALKLISLKQTLTLKSVPPTTLEATEDLHETVLKENASRTLNHSGIHISDTTATASLEVEVTYMRAGRTWHQQEGPKVIDVADNIP
jgi:hypothetical protein